MSLLARSGSRPHSTYQASQYQRAVLVLVLALVLALVLVLALALALAQVGRSVTGRACPSSRVESRCSCRTHAPFTCVMVSFTRRAPPATGLRSIGLGEFQAQLP